MPHLPGFIPAFLYLRSAFLLRDECKKHRLNASFPEAGGEPEGAVLMYDSVPYSPIYTRFEL